MPLHITALGDHPALRIIDTFADNRSPHEALNGISPDDATKTAHERSILDINIAKNRKTKTVSDLNIGDYVRKDLFFNDKSSKGIDPK